MRTSNPTLSEKIFLRTREMTGEGVATMTVNGTVSKTLILLLCATFTGALVWNLFFSTQGHSPYVFPLMITGAIGGFILALITAFKPTYSPILAPIYALLEGLFLGGISAFFESAYNGIVMQAIPLTLGVMLVMLVVYRTGLIRVTEKLRMGIIAATGAIALVYLLSFVMQMFGMQMPYLHSSGPIGIGISLVIVGVAAFNLLLDFDFIDRGAQAQAPKFMEWYGAFGLMVTLVWLYIEILRLLSKLRR